MAAGYCTQELEQAANQLLPQEIIAEIGVVAATNDDTMNSAAVIEGLATHLASILGLAGMTTHHRSRPANATPHDQRHVSNWVLMTTNGNGMMAHAAPDSGKNDSMVLCHANVKMFPTTSPVAPPPAVSADLLPERRQFGRGTGVFFPARHPRGTGTGVFMPIAGAYSARPFKSSRNRGAKPPRLMRKEDAQVEMAMAMRLHDGRVASPRPQLPVLP